MNPAEALNAIEDRRFAALTNLASNLKTFLRIAAQQPEVEVLSRSIADDPAVASEVLQRALALAASPVEGEVESEADAALATYWWLLSQHRRDFAQTVADSLRDRRDFFWARKLADGLPPLQGGVEANGNQAKEEGTAETAQGVEALHPKP
jgi:hypothetical protein